MIFHNSKDFSIGWRLFLGQSLIAIAVTLTTGGTLPAEDSLASLAKGYLQKAIASARGKLSGEATEAESISEPVAETDGDLQDRALREAAQKIFHPEGGYHFTQSRWGASPTPYQIEGLEFIPLEEAPATVSDTRLGIDRRVTYQIRAKQFRRFHDQTGWGRWVPGLPPHLETFVLVRENGVWKVTAAPDWAYTVN